jgi:hypothetical protein
MAISPLPTDRAALEAIATELATAERAVATRIATAEAILLVRRQRLDPRFQCQEAQSHLEREFERLRAKYSDWTWPALPLSGKCLDMPPKDQCYAMQHLDYLRVLYREIVRLQREVATKLAELANAEDEPAEDPNAVERLLAAELRRQGKAIPAALVECMISRESATAEEIAEKVHGDPLISEDAIGTNCRRTSGAAEPLGSPLRYRYRGGHVFKELLI